MEFWPVLVLLGGIVSMDMTSGPQFMVSEPLVSCTLLGILFGMPVTGVLLGILFQLLWLGYMPLGAVRFIDHVMAAFIAASSLMASARVFEMDEVHVRAGLLPVMLFGLLAGSVGLRLNDFIRNRSGKLSEALLVKFERGETPNIAMWHLAGMSFSFLKGAGMVIVFVPAGIFLCGLVRYLPGGWSRMFASGSMIILGTVTASALNFYWVNGKRRFLLYGSLGGFFWVLLMLV